MFPTLSRRLALTRRLAQAVESAAEVPTTATASPAAPAHPVYRLRKKWPPDFSTMSPQQQFRFEKKFKRRITDARATPRFDMALRLFQVVITAGMFGCPCVELNLDLLTCFSVFLTWGTLFLDYGTLPHPFGPVRWILPRFSYPVSSLLTRPWAKFREAFFGFFRSLSDDPSKLKTNNRPSA
ncbi:uncharacterized protein C8A04DRAFT_13629 [Dichotomopilus funicola]|uniref:Uncharacterized protein n=1 Tax=Dichotomopilus funicola TaxID=1934379 RepID=A0AAN6ZLT8_9PEZI|nr:hypothetical protein C8A04DRAFT_13629 [Dichotomopilus funicola]